MTESEAIKDVKIAFDTKDTGYGCISKDTGTTIISRNRLASEKPIFDFNSSDTLSRFHCVCGKIITFQRKTLFFRYRDISCFS